MQTTASYEPVGRLKRQVKAGVSQSKESSMPLSKYNTAFGGKPGAAVKAMRSMQKTYGPKKGESVFYATKNKRQSPMASMQRKK
jgi:hypothetical protein